MIDYEVFMEIKILYRQGKSIREISRILRISRNTIRRYLRREEKPSYKRKNIQATGKLTPFYDYLNERVQAASPQWLPATALYREIIELGYQGKISLLRNYLRTLKPCSIEEPVVRFETEAGQQMQVDWIIFRRGKQSLSAFVATLGYSRATFVEFVTDEKLETLLYCHEQAFQFFDGVPREILYDNMRTIVIERNAYAKGHHRFQIGFLDFAKHYNFIPRLCKPYRARTKGKVERFNRYLRYSFYYPLVSRLKPLGLLIDKELANYEVKKWLRDIANQRCHATTQQVPLLRLEEEKKYLQFIPITYKCVKSNHCKPQTLVTPQIFNLQHSLSIYDNLLKGAVA